MKKILSIALLIITSIVGKAQYPVQQNIGSGATLVKNPDYGGLQGGLIPFSFTDTSVANTALIYGKNYNGFLLYTTNCGCLWFRVGTRWVQVLPSGSISDTLAWRLQGNAVTGMIGEPFIGTTDNFPLNIGTNNQKRIVLPAAGVLRSTGSFLKYLAIDTTAGSSNGNLYYTDAVSTTPTWQQTLTAGSTLDQNNTIDGGNFRFVFNSLGNGSRFYLSPTLVAASKFDITQKSSNNVDSAYFYLQKSALSAVVKSVIGLWDNTNGITSELSQTISGGIPLTLLRRISSSNSLDYNLRIDGGGINMYAQNSTATGNALIRAEPDSIVNKMYNASDPTVYSYLNVYKDSIYGKVNGKIVFGSNWADQYADDSLFWRTTDNSAVMKIVPNEIEIYAGTSEIEVTSTDININPASFILNFGGGTTASAFRFLEPNGSGSNYSSLQSGAQAANAAYIFPTGLPAGNGYILASTTGGQWSWTDPTTLTGLGYIAVTGTSTATGAITLDMSGSDFTISDGSSTGNIVLSPSSGQIDLTMDAAAKTFTATATNGYFFNTGTVQMNAYGAGAATFDGSGNITSVSDKRAKHDIKPFTYGLNSILKLQTSSFIYNQDNSNTVMSGFIAQDVMKAIPIAVHSNKTGMLSLETNAILAANVNAVKELYSMIVKQQNEIELLKQQLKNKK